MSTRAQIALKLYNGEYGGRGYESICVASNVFPGFMMDYLCKYYNSEYKLRRLMHHGNLVALGRFIMPKNDATDVCQFVSSEVPLPATKEHSTRYENLRELLAHAAISLTEYVYIYDKTNGRYCWSYINLSELHDVHWSRRGS